MQKRGVGLNLNFYRIISLEKSQGSSDFIHTTAYALSCDVCLTNTHTAIRLTHHSTLQATNSTFKNRRRVHLYTPSSTRTCNTAYDTPLLWRNAHISNGGLAVGFVRSSIPICRPVQVVLNAGTLHCSQPGPGLWFPVLFLQIVRDSNLFLILRYQLDGLAHNTQIHHHPHTRPESNTSRSTERSHNRTGTRCANCHRKDKQ